MLSPNVPSQALWLEPKQRTRINCTMQIYKNMQLSKLRGCQTYLPNYAVAVQRKLHLQYIHTYIHTYIHMYIALHYITLHYLHYTTLHYTTLHYITLHYTTLHCITLHYITLHYVTLHYIHPCMHAYIHQSMHAYQRTEIQTDNDGQTMTGNCRQSQAMRGVRTHQLQVIDYFQIMRSSSIVVRHIHTIPCP